MTRLHAGTPYGVAPPSMAAFTLPPAHASHEIGLSSRLTRKPYESYGGNGHVDPAPEWDDGILAA
jgi:hypothetical protein